MMVDKKLILLSSPDCGGEDLKFINTTLNNYLKKSSLNKKYEFLLMNVNINTIDKKELIKLLKGE